MFRSFLRPVAAIATLAGLAAYAAIMLRGPQGLNALAEKHRQIRALEEDNANLAREIEARKLYIDRLKHDPNTQELELQKLGFLHRNDTQFKTGGQHIVPPVAAPSTDPASIVTNEVKPNAR